MIHTMPPDTWHKITDVIADLGLSINQVAELTVEPWGISAWVYALDEDGLRFVNDDTHRVAREHHFYPSPAHSEGNT